METTPSTKGDLEVTGVSRSGRVRKKSSKLMDFQSPDEIEPRPKKATIKQQPTTKQIQQFTRTSLSSPISDHSPRPNAISSSTFSPEPKTDDELLSPDEFNPGEHDDSLDSDVDTDDGDDDPILDNDDDENYVDPTVRQSIYMSEKTSKKKIMKDGKVVFGKAQRKDKGKTRFTAYMLWAKDIRKQMLNQQPDLDFATISRRLGEMWANVPAGEKYNWKRRAKRQATRVKNAERKDTKIPTKFLNKGSTSSSNRGVIKKMSILENFEHASDTIECSNILQSQSSKTSPVVGGPSGMYKVTGIDPLDVAAHLKLLGDSLSIIGERLKEHEGQITVSGSLSVLLDSLLCSLGPLMCLTVQIPGVEEANHKLRECLQNTLDNIAYVMPGL